MILPGPGYEPVAESWKYTNELWDSTRYGEFLEPRRNC